MHNSSLSGWKYPPEEQEKNPVKSEYIKGQGREGISFIFLLDVTFLSASFDET